MKPDILFYKNKFKYLLQKYFCAQTRTSIKKYTLPTRAATTKIVVVQKCTKFNVFKPIFLTHHNFVVFVVFIVLCVAAVVVKVLWVGEKVVLKKLIINTILCGKPYEEVNEPTA